MSVEQLIPDIFRHEAIVLEKWHQVVLVSYPEGTIPRHKIAGE